MSWILRQAQGKVIIPPPEQRKKPEWQGHWIYDYEDDYGDGRYAEYKSALITLLRDLARRGRANLEGVYQTLADAKKAATEAARPGTGIDWKRARSLRQRRALADLMAGLGHLRVLYAECEYDDDVRTRAVEKWPPEVVRVLAQCEKDLAAVSGRSSPELPNGIPELAFLAEMLRAVVEGVPETLALGDALHKALRNDPLLQVPLQSRRSSQGHPQPWLQEARRRLREHGVYYRKDREQLLQCARLLDHKVRRTTPRRKKPLRKPS